MAEKFIKDEKGIVLYTTTSNLQLEKPLVSDNYDINVHNRNMDKIDIAINEVKGQVDGLELTSTKVKRPNGKNVEESLLANETSISEVSKIAESAKNRGDEVKNLLVGALISLGVQASTSETFEQLIEKIKSIDILEAATGISANFNTGGKKATTINGTGSYDLKKWVIVENISFKKNPKFVLVYFDYNGWLSTSIYSSSMNAVFAGMYKRDNITGDRCMAFNGSMLDVSVTKDRICIPMNPDLSAAIDVNWIAIA